MSASRQPRAYRLVLADGEVFEGEGIGADSADGIVSGEVVFNTVLSGYQEVITDPSYAGQVITFTYPHIGNYGVNPTDDEARRPFCRGVIIRDLARRHSNWRSEGDLDSFLRSHGLAGIAGVDTRRLTRHIRDFGAMPGAFGSADVDELQAAAIADPTTSGVDLVSVVSTREPYTIGSGTRRVVAYDLGVKSTMLRHLSELATVTVVPADTPASDVLASSPDGVFLSNGPGDPQMAGSIVTELPKLLGRVPIFGICLGHQVLSLALGGTTFKMKFGHHGGNVPVKDVRSGKVEITSQNHNFAVEIGSVPDVVETHLCLNDGALEGMFHKDLPVFGVQYHPEAGPGPHDSRYLFEDFARLMDTTGSVA
ncbi:MAG: glutamine-hydrolyzing carbamoyl-phosphate synthase small subunit [Acidimicrobiaceae bacterium]|nr:glutamine-hydrolyzing carbamoyl-phosphate synthase small subunit [Acidimicrobiaceae bacterium]MDE0607789.1 glutamine-hydrolyzing carbamoyl-phosphate synthase small subunit [Acidimicrobiaceae bacterium]